MTTQPSGIDVGLSIITRHGHPDYLDLPWDRPLEEWQDVTERLIRVRRGLSRHVVRMVQYEGRVYALKETERPLAEHEYRILRRLEDARLPAVRAVGVVNGRPESDGSELGRNLASAATDWHCSIKSGLIGLREPRGSGPRAPSRSVSDHPVGSVTRVTGRFGSCDA